MIQISNLYKKFDCPVLENLNLTIPDGAIFGLVGINGAGKSTLLNLLAGILKADLGSILFDGESVYENWEVKKNIFFLPDDPFYTRNTTPRNLIQVYKTFYDFSEIDYFDYLAKFNIPINKSMYNFSKGMKRQVFVALSLAIKPKYLFLDEAFDGLDPIARMTLKKELIKVQTENNMTVIISSHSLRELSDICDTYGILDAKKIESSGDIGLSLKKYHKYTMAFDKELTEVDFDIDFVSFSREKRIINCITKLDFASMQNAVSKFNPIILEEMNIDFEELFVLEVQNRGYLK